MIQKPIYILIASFFSLTSLAQVHLVDTSTYDIIVVKEALLGIRPFIGIQKDSLVFLPKDTTTVTMPTQKCMESGLKVFITNAEEDQLIGTTVQVMDGDKQIASGVADFTGYLYLPNIEPGTYVVIIRHVAMRSMNILLTIPSDNEFSLRTELKDATCCITVTVEPVVEDPFVTTYTTDQIIRTP